MVQYIAHILVFTEQNNDNAYEYYTFIINN